MTEQGLLDPLSATAELSDLYKLHPEWIDRLKLASADIEQVKRELTQHADSEQMDFHSIVVLNEGKERVWAFNGYMTKPLAQMRIELLRKKMREQTEATQRAVRYWKHRFP